MEIFADVIVNMQKVSRFLQIDFERLKNLFKPPILSSLDPIKGQLLVVKGWKILGWKRR